MFCSRHWLHFKILVLPRFQLFTCETTKFFFLNVERQEVHSYRRASVRRPSGAQSKHFRARLGSFKWLANTSLSNSSGSKRLSQSAHVCLLSQASQNATFFSPWVLESRCSLALCHRWNTLDADRHDTRRIDDLRFFCRSLPPGGSSCTDDKNVPSCTRDTTCRKLAKHAAAMPPPGNAPN